MKPRDLRIRDYVAADQAGLITLWEQCGLTRRWNDPRLDIWRKLESQADWILVAVLSDRIVGSVMIGYDGHRGWINYLSVSPDQQKTGIGRALMAKSELYLRELNCPKINLQVRASNQSAVAFYEAIGFLQDDVLSFGKRLVDDEASAKDKQHDSDH